MCMGVLPACRSVHHVLRGVQGGQKRAQDALELELPVVVSHSVRPGSLAPDSRTASALNP